MAFTHPSYQYYKDIFKGKPMPFAFVDMDLLEENAKNILTRAGEKKIRVASKSIRCIAVLKKVFEFNPRFNGIMCFSLPETVFLSKNGFDDILMGYPCMQENFISDVCGEIVKGKKIILMIDCIEHAQKANEIAAKNKVVLPLCMDMDMSSSFPFLYFGVNRSPLKNQSQILNLIDDVLKMKNVRL